MEDPTNRENVREPREEKTSYKEDQCANLSPSMEPIPPPRELQAFALKDDAAIGGVSGGGGCFVGILADFL